jgi:hypothetical protein
MASLTRTPIYRIKKKGSVKMAIPVVQEPLYLFERPFANEGTKNIIPATNNETTGLASQTNGFPAITQVPIKAGGIAPTRADFNGILYMLS